MQAGYVLKRIPALQSALMVFILFEISLIALLLTGLPLTFRPRSSDEMLLDLLVVDLVIFER